jgi:hypothetical protein
MLGHRLFQDDLPSVSISRLRASGVMTSDTKSVDIVFGDGLRREVRVVHRRFPNGGEWSFFLCPVCSRPARVLKLHEKPMCRRCCLREEIGYRVSQRHAQRACRCAIGRHRGRRGRQELSRIQQKLRLTGWPSVRLRIAA